ncbi:alpha/beta fold hydrolase [Acidianus manzaensis]|uniref:alpha/beta fold hydrolase n=1 Tax=Acidianus manzaensis TaxID=282676 RepID=UPI001650B286|nr:alpha/beta hydrolase [Acidianus manzaensis]
MPFIILDDVRIYYENLGSGRPLVFIHHLAGSFKSWIFQNKYFSSKYSVIVYDLRGHGRSSVLNYPYLIEDHSKDLKGLLEYLRIDNPIIIGHSIGTLIALDYATKFNVEKLVLIGALYKAPDPDPYYNYVRIATSFGMEALAEYRRLHGEFSEALISNYTAWNLLLQVYKENNPLGYKYAVEGLLKSKDYSNDLSKIDEDTLLIYGSEDKLSKNAEIFKQNISKLKLNIISGYGHFLNFEAPEELNNVISNFL